MTGNAKALAELRDHKAPKHGDGWYDKPNEADSILALFNERFRK